MLLDGQNFLFFCSFNEIILWQVLVRLVGGDDHMYPNFLDVMQWLADSNLLEMIVDKLNPSVSVNFSHWFDACNKKKIIVYKSFLLPCILNKHYMEYLEFIIITC